MYCYVFMFQAETFARKRRPRALTVQDKITLLPGKFQQVLSLIFLT